MTEDEVARKVAPILARYHRRSVPVVAAAPSRRTPSVRKAAGPTPKGTRNVVPGVGESGGDQGTRPPAHTPTAGVPAGSPPD